MSRGGDRCQRIYTSNGRNMFIYVKLPRRSLWTGWWAMMPNYRALCTADQRIYWGRLHANRKGVVGVAGVYWAGKTEADDLFKFNCGERAFVRVVCRMLWTVNGCRRFVCVWCIMSSLGIVCACTLRCQRRVPLRYRWLVNGFYENQQEYIVNTCIIKCVLIDSLLF